MGGQEWQDDEEDDKEYEDDDYDEEEDREKDDEDGEEDNSDGEEDEEQKQDPDPEFSRSWNRSQNIKNGRLRKPCSQTYKVQRKSQNRKRNNQLNIFF